MSLLGLKAPELNLQNGDFEHINFTNFKDSKLVLLFYPLAFSSVCTTELCTIRDNMKIYNSLNAKVCAISVDSLFVQKAFKQSQNLNFELLSDFNKIVSISYGCINNDYYGMKGVSKRAAFVIDKKGMVRYEEILEKDDKLPDFSKIQNTLAQLG
jgi:peroxiredoxin